MSDQPIKKHKGGTKRKNPRNTKANSANNEYKARVKNKKI